MTWENFRDADILVVDDESANLRLFGRHLSRAGYQQVELLSDPRDVVPRVQEREPDLILLDVTMPYMDGFEVLERLRDVVPRTTYLPVIVVTGHSDSNSIFRALSAGAKDFQTKPIDFVELLLRVRIQLETRHELLALQEAGRRRDAYLRTVVDTVPDVLFARDDEGRIRMANRTTSEILGITPEELVGRLHREVVRPTESFHLLDEQIQSVLTSGAPKMSQRRFENPLTGEHMWFETRVVPLYPPDGGPAQALVVGTDFTARHRAEEALETSQHEVLARLAQAAEYRDDDTGTHTRRVGKLSAAIARLLDHSEREVSLIRQAAPLHDLGKIAIPDSILLKPGKLTTEEYEIMKMHAEIGGKLLSGGMSELIRLAEEIALSHHERWDGQGYPRGLREDEINRAARVVALADVVDALSHKRPYRPPLPKSEVMREVRANRGLHFDPRCVDACLEILDANGDDWAFWTEAVA